MFHNRILGNTQFIGGKNRPGRGERTGEVRMETAYDSTMSNETTRQDTSGLDPRFTFSTR